MWKIIFLKITTICKSDFIFLNENWVNIAATCKQTEEKQTTYMYVIKQNFALEVNQKHFWYDLSYKLYCI